MNKEKKLVQLTLEDGDARALLWLYSLGLSASKMDVPDIIKGVQIGKLISRETKASLHNRMRVLFDALGNDEEWREWTESATKEI
jgi:hypothetical protein